jgi:predicted GNAT family acetyltransferase
MSAADVRVVDHSECSRYELLVGGELAAAANYRLDDGRVCFTHTELMTGFEGRGLGGLLAAGALDDVRRNGHVVAADCPFMATFIEDHPGYASLLAN